MLAIIGSFTLVMVGVSMLGKEEITGLVVNEAGELVIPTESAKGGTEHEQTAPGLSTSSPRLEKVHLSGANPNKRANRKLVRNAMPGDKPAREEVRKSLTEAHLAVTEQRAIEAAQAKADAKAPEATPEKKLSEVAGAKAVEDKKPGESKDYRRVLLAQAVREALVSPEPWKELIAIAMVQAGLPDVISARETIAIAQRLIPPSNNPAETGGRLVSITQALVNIGDLDAALDVAMGIVHEEKKNQAVSSVVWAHVSRRQFSAAKTLAAGLSLSNFKEGSYRNIAEAEANIGENNPAMSTAGLISNLSLKNDAIHRIALAQARSSQWGSALSTANLVLDTAKNQQILADIARVRIDAGDIAGAQSSIHALKNENVRDELYGRVANRYASLKDIPSASRVSGMIMDKNYQENILANISVQQARHGDTSGGFNSARSLLNYSAKSQALTSVTMIEADKRGAEAALNMASLIDNEVTRDAAYRSIAQREAGQGRLGKALNCLQNMASNECRLMTQAEIAVSALRNNPSRQAVHLLEDTALQSFTVQDVHRRTNMVITLAYGYALLNRYEEAIGYINDLPSSSTRNNAFRQMALDCVNRNQVERAVDFCNRIDNVNTRKGLMQDIAGRHANNVMPPDAQRELRRFESNEQRAQFLRVMAGRK